VKNLLFIYIFLVVVFFTTSCIPDPSPAVTGATFQQFQQEVILLAGPDAYNCGYTQVDDDRTELSTCVVEHYLADDPNYAIYDLQGIDSNLSAAVAYNNSNEMYFLFFDSDPMGGARNNNGEISVRKCIEPSIVGEILGEGLFNCQSTINQ